MTIAQIVDKFLPITETLIFTQIKGLETKGIKSKIFCHKIINSKTYPYNQIYSYKDQPAHKLIYYKIKGKLNNHDSAMLYWNKILKHEKINLVHSHFGWAAQKGIELAIKNNLPHIVTFYGADVTRDPYDTNKKYYQQKLPLIFSYSKKILCTSNFLKNNLIRLGAPENKVIVWRPAISINIPKVNKKNDKIFRIISIGRFIDWKGQKYLIKALPKIINKYKNIKVVFIGTGPELERCKILAKNLNVAKCIDFLGKLSNYNEVLKKMVEADIIVHPSYTAKRGVNDALGVVLAEAAMCGTPGIASNCGGMPEIILNDKTGLLVKEKCSEDIADKIIYLINNPDLLKSMATEAKIYSSNMFNFENQLYKLTNLILD